MAVPDPLVVVVGIGAVVLGYLGVRVGVARRIERQRLQSIPEADVGELEGPTVRTSGRARPADEGTFPAPFTGNDALYADWEIQEFDRDGGRRARWRTIGEGSVGRPISLEDDTGSVRVEIDEDLAADVDSRLTTTMVFDPDEDVPTRVRDFLDAPDTPDHRDPRLGEKMAGGLTSIGRRKYHEARIEPDEELYCYGRLERDGEVLRPSFVSTRSFETQLHERRPERAELFAVLGGLLGVGGIASLFVLL